MFTGLIEDLGVVAALTRAGDDVTLSLSTSIPTEELTLGESIAVNGVCLTVTTIGDGSFTADASTETLTRSALGRLKVGDRVHLERALRLSDRLGGHIVQGHVDGVGRIERTTEDGRAWQILLEVPAQLRPELVEKGSITVDGVSLTVNELTPRGCRLTIVRFTEQKTRLVAYPPGTRVNIETDIIGKYVRRLLSGSGSQTAELLERYGYTNDGDR